MSVVVDIVFPVDLNCGTVSVRDHGVLEIFHTHTLTCNLAWCSPTTGRYFKNSIDFRTHIRFNLTLQWASLISYSSGNFANSRKKGTTSRFQRNSPMFAEASTTRIASWHVGQIPRAKIINIFFEVMGIFACYLSSKTRAACMSLQPQSKWELYTKTWFLCDVWLDIFSVFLLYISCCGLFPLLIYTLAPVHTWCFRSCGYNKFN